MPVRAELARSSEGKLVNEAGGVDELHVEAGRPAFGFQVVDVLRVGEGLAAGRFDWRYSENP